MFYVCWHASKCYYLLFLCFFHFNLGVHLFRTRSHYSGRLSLFHLNFRCTKDFNTNTRALSYLQSSQNISPSGSRVYIMFYWQFSLGHLEPQISWCFILWVNCKILTSIIFIDIIICVGDWWIWVTVTRFQFVIQILLEVSKTM